MADTAAAAENQQHAKIPGKAWGILIVTLFVTISAPLNMFKCPGLAPQLMEYFGFDPSTFGWTMSIYTIMGIVLAFPAAGIMAKLGAKNTVTISVAFTIVGTVIGALAPTGAVTVLLVGRFLEGVSMGLIAVAAPAALSRWFPRHKRGLALGIWAPWVPIGNIIMLNAAAPLANAFGGWQAAWWFGAIWGIVAIILWMVVYKDPAQPIVDPGEVEEAEAAAKAAGGKLPQGALLSMVLICIAFFIFNVTQNGTINTFYPSWLMTERGFDQAGANFITSIITILAIPSAICGGAIADKLKSRKIVILIGFIAILIGGFMYFTWTATWMLWVCVIIAGLFPSFATTNIFAAPAEVMGPAGLGLGMAMVACFQNLGSFVGGIALGNMQVSMGWGTASLVLFIPLLVIAILCTIFAKRLH